MKKVYMISAIIVILGIAAGISFFIIRDMTAKIPDHITLLTDDEKVYDFAESDKKLKLVEFIYTHCPDICPTTTQRMNLLKGDLSKEGVFGEKVQFITVTIDPYRDTTEVLRTYRNTFEIENDGNWVFLTAEPDKLKKDQAEIQELANTFNFSTVIPVMVSMFIAHLCICLTRIISLLRSSQWEKILIRMMFSIR